MKCYCRSCEINWGRLLTCDDEIEVCPKCLTDTFLVDGKEVIEHYMCAVTAKVFEVGTDKELVLDKPIVNYYRSKDQPALTETKTQHERSEDKALESYFKSGNPEDYHKAFRTQ